MIEQHGIHMITTLETNKKMQPVKTMINQYFFDGIMYPCITCTDTFMP